MRPGRSPRRAFEPSAGQLQSSVVAGGGLPGTDVQVEVIPAGGRLHALLGRYAEERLLELAALKDRGLTTESFVHAAANFFPRWEAAGIAPEQAARIRETVLRWRKRLAG